MRTIPTRLGRVHFRAPAPAGFIILRALEIAHVAVDGEDRDYPVPRGWDKV